MKILYVYSSFASWGGVERIMIDKMNLMVQQTDCQVYALTYDQGEHKMPYNLDSRVCHADLNVRTHAKYQYFGFRRLWEGWSRDVLLYQRLEQKISEISPDIIITTTSGELSLLLSLKGNIPLVVESHGGYEHLIDYPYMNLFHSIAISRRYRLLKRVDAIVSLTEIDAIRWRRSYSQVRVIPNLVHLNPTDNYSNVNRKRIIFVGRLAEQKGLPELLRVWNIVYHRHPDWTLDIYGEGVLEGLCNSIEGLNVHPPVSDIFSCYNESSMLVLTSLWEPFGLVIPEAMSCGLPVVSFEGDGPSSIITDGQDGFVVKDRNVDVFAEYVCQLIEDQPLRERMGQAAIRSAQRYRAENIMPLWKKMFAELVKQ